MQHKITKFIVFMLVGIGIIAASVWWWVQYKHGLSPLSSGADVERTVPRKEDAGNATFTNDDSSEGTWRRLSRWESSDDVELVTRRFKGANDCLLYHSARRELSAILNDERLGDLSDETPATLKDLDATSSRYVSIVNETEDYCIGSDREALAKIYTDAVFKAALLGNPDAESCFVISNISPLETPSAAAYTVLEDRYFEHALIFTERALERFDPYVAEHVLNQYIASPGVHPSKLDSMAKPDPYLTWQMARLASLRALPDQRARLEGKLALFEDQHALRADEVKRADALAVKIYERNFSRHSPIDLDRQVPCYSKPSLAP